MRHCVQTVAGEESELVRVLAHRGHSHLVGAVEVHVGQLVREALDLNKKVYELVRCVSV